MASEISSPLLHPWAKNLLIVDDLGKVYSRSLDRDFQIVRIIIGMLRPDYGHMVLKCQINQYMDFNYIVILSL